MIEEKELPRKLIIWSKEIEEDYFDESIRQIKDFNKIFTKNKIKNLTIDDYALGRNDENLSYWVEYSTKLVASLGGYGSKHRLFFKKKENIYKYPKKYKNERECFKDIKNNLIKLYRLVEEDKPEDFEKIDLPNNQAIKIVYLLNSDSFLPILTKSHIRKICVELGIKHEDLNPLQQNGEILNYLRRIPALKDYHTIKLGHFFYQPISGLNLRGKDLPIEEPLSPKVYEPVEPEEKPKNPKKRPEKKEGKGTSGWSTNPRFAKKAIVDADYQCEYDNSHLTFTSNTTEKNFVEAHHLIPMSAQDNFEFELDTPDNIIALCPNCHSKFHYAKEKEKINLMKFFLEKRIERLKERKIETSLDKLKKAYESSGEK